MKDVTEFKISDSEFNELKLEGRPNPLRSATAVEGQKKFDALPSKIREKFNFFADAAQGNFKALSKADEENFKALSKADEENFKALSDDNKKAQTDTAVFVDGLSEFIKDAVGTKLASYEFSSVSFDGKDDSTIDFFKPGVTPEGVEKGKLVKILLEFLSDESYTESEYGSAEFDMKHPDDSGRYFIFSFPETITNGSKLLIDLAAFKVTHLLPNGTVEENAFLDACETNAESVTGKELFELLKKASEFRIISMTEGSLKATFYFQTTAKAYADKVASTAEKNSKAYADEEIKALPIPKVIDTGDMYEIPEKELPFTVPGVRMWAKDASGFVTGGGGVVLCTSVGPYVDETKISMIVQNDFGFIYANLTPAFDYTDEKIKGIDLSSAVKDSKAYTDEKVGELVGIHPFKIYSEGKYTDKEITGIDLEKLRFVKLSNYGSPFDVVNRDATFRVVDSADNEHFCDFGGGLLIGSSVVIDLTTKTTYRLFNDGHTEDCVVTYDTGKDAFFSAFEGAKVFGVYTSEPLCVKAEFGVVFDSARDYTDASIQSAIVDSWEVAL